MYRKRSKGWYKHKDFILLDLVSVFVALLLADLVRNGEIHNLYIDEVYRNAGIFVVLADLCVIVLFEFYKGVLRRGYYLEFCAVVRQALVIELCLGLYLFSADHERVFSRIVLYLTGIFYCIITYVVRIWWKWFLKKSRTESGQISLYLITTTGSVSDMISSIRENKYDRYRINGIVIADQDLTGKEIQGIPVVADMQNAAGYVCQQWVDEVLIDLDEDTPYLQELLRELLQMGIVVHMNLEETKGILGQKHFVEKIGEYTVLTMTMNYITDAQALAKRLMDIVGGLIGCICTGILFVFVAPVIYFSSPGPIFFSQTRIGQNGKPFRMYKFRSMYMDAEAKKQELMGQNKIKDNRMFKLDFDPRVIGNKILPDGTKKTGIGEFIRKTSIDEFPQFWNVLNGTMSLVGTRPVLPEEFSAYEMRHRMRIAVKPGITGMWQVSGRNDIIDFEEVVRLDTEYITNWSLGLDIKILLKTVKVVLKRSGAA